MEIAFAVGLTCHPDNVAVQLSHSIVSKGLPQHRLPIYHQVSLTYANNEGRRKRKWLNARRRSECPSPTLDVRYSIYELGHQADRSMQSQADKCVIEQSNPPECRRSRTSEGSARHQLLVPLCYYVRAAIAAWDANPVSTLPDALLAPAVDVQATETRFDT